MKNKMIITSILILVVIIIALGIFIFNNSNVQIEDVYGKNYEDALLKIEEGNNYTIQRDLTDGCFPYRIYHRGCYYSDEDNYVANPSFIPNPQNLTHDELINLCYSFAHKGATAFCLKSNFEKQKCLNFARTNDYLIRICNLEEGELIPSQMMGPYETDTAGYKVDSLETIELVKYSDLI
jgi:hypothetical protein